MQDNQEQVVASNVADLNVTNSPNVNVPNVTNITDLNVEKKKRGNPTWGKGMQSPNPAGRPVEEDREKKTNREIRTKLLMQLLRKLAPHQSKAVMAAVRIIDNQEASDQNKLKASALIIATYRDLIKETYNNKFDDEQAEEPMDNSPVFSLKMIGDEKVA